MDRRTLTFTLVMVVLTLLAALPGPFDWANRIEPTLFGMSFAMLWQFLIAALFCIAFVAWYLTDVRSGELDLDTEVVARAVGTVDADFHEGEQPPDRP